MNDQNSDHIWAIVPAAGVGKRVGSHIPKQYLPLHDCTILEWTIATLLKLDKLRALVCVISEGDEYWPDLQYASNSQVRVASGGTERCYSVLNGLQAIADEAQKSDWVLVHDAARPCVRTDDIKKLLKECQQYNNGGILAMPVRDTMKLSDDENRITQTLDRSRMWHALTPQCFRYGELVSALQNALDDGFEVTDEASAIEHTGGKPLLIEAHSDNIKVTLPHDLQLAAHYLKQQGRVS